MARFAEVAQRQFDTGEIEYLPAVTDSGGEAAMPGQEPLDYYGTARSASPGWVNRTTRLSLRELLTFDAAVGADFIAPTPTLIVHGRTDHFCPRRRQGSSGWRADCLRGVRSRLTSPAPDVGPACDWIWSFDLRVVATV
jgi:hypothetical protein